MDRRLILLATAILAIGLLALAAFGLRRSGRAAGPDTERAKISVETKEVEGVPPPGEEVHVVALVLDDFGYTKVNLDALRNIDVPLTLAVLPNTPYAGYVCSFADENNFEVILHLPMEPEGENASLEENTIRADMDRAVIMEHMERAFSSVPSARGASNHMGSKATCDEALMTIVLGELKKRNMFFLDSFTAEGSICAETARTVGVPCMTRDIFIDNERDRGYIEKRLKALEQLAFTRKHVVAIGHDRGVTVECLREAIPGMKEKGIRFVYLSEIAEKEQNGPQSTVDSRP